MAIRGLKSRTARGFTSKLFIQSRGTAKNLNSDISSVLVVTGSQVHATVADGFTQVSRIALIGPRFQESRSINFISSLYQCCAIAPTMISNHKV